MKSSGMADKHVLIMAILFLPVFLTLGCVTVSNDWVEPKGSNSVLYVSRGDTFASYGATVSFYLNDQKIADIGKEQYILLHVKPGSYNAEFRIFDSNGEKIKSIKWTGELPPETLYEAVANYFFGWQSTARFMKINPDIAILKANFQEEIDLTDSLEPL